VFILKEVKVVCFDALLEVLILKVLYCTDCARCGVFRMGQTKHFGLLAGSRKQKRQQ
jgi:hypothetical protein